MNCTRDDSKTTCTNTYKDKKNISTCSSLTEEACKFANEFAKDAGCSLWMTSYEICNGKISQPKNEEWCIVLGTMGTSFGFTTNRYSAYREDASSCPSDCVVENTCGNGKCESAQACILNTTDCENISDSKVCSTVVWCAVKETTTTTCEGEFSCATFTDKDECAKYSCDRSADNKCIDTYKDEKKTSGMCSSFSSDLCKTLSDESKLCSQNTKTTTSCNGIIETPADNAKCVSLNTIINPFWINAERKTTYEETETSCSKDCAAPSGPKCGDGKVEWAEKCDDGSDNGKNGKCNQTCDGYVLGATCWNFIIEKENGETCDDGPFLNGKPGQCNSSCNGWASYNNYYCGDGMCKSSCTIDTDTCSSLNTSDSTKALCTDLWCSLQYTDTSTCKGTVSCKEITPEKFWNSLEWAHKYCDIAWCNRDKQKNLCTAPNDSPSCESIGKSLWLTSTKEYCPRIPWCTQNIETIKTTCVGTTPLRADKLNESQCVTMKGKRAKEDVNRCNTDCQTTCNNKSTDGKKCSELTAIECANHYSLADKPYNCIVKKGEDGNEICTEDTYTCTTCGNGVCDAKEKEQKACPQDCVTDQPEVLYSKSAPDDWSLIEWPVKASVYLPSDCKITNNNGQDSYYFKYNGYYIFQVMCSWFEKPRSLVAKVYRLNTDTITAINAKDIVSTSGWSLVYLEKENEKNLITDIPSLESVADTTKKAIYEQTLISAAPDAWRLNTEITNGIIMSGNISFENDSNVYNKIAFEKDINNTLSTKKVKLTVQSDVILQQESEWKVSDFNGVFLAPTKIESWAVLNAASKSIENLDTVIKAWDNEDKTVFALDKNENIKPFEMNVFTRDLPWKIIDIYMSQDGTSREFYTWALVEPCVDTGVAIWIYCASFTVPHLTYYGITTNLTDKTNEEPENNGWNVWGGSYWGGGGSISLHDICPATRDCNDTSLDTICGACTGTLPTYIPISWTIVITPENELQIAYQYAFLHNITTMSYTNARLGDPVTRGELAKMIVNFAKNVLGKTGNTQKVCAFSDNIYGTKEDKSFIIQACQMGLMGLKSNGATVNETFNPTWIVSRAEFGTVFSRLMYGAIHNSTVHSSAPYYENHLKALQRDGIMKKIDQPENKEQRGFVMLMMMRSDLQDKELNVTQQTEDSNNIVKFFQNLFQNN